MSVRNTLLEQILAAIEGGSGGDPAGPNQAVQFNDNDSLGGDATFLFDPALKQLTVQDIVITNNATVQGTLLPNNITDAGESGLAPAISQVWYNTDRNALRVKGSNGNLYSSMVDSASVIYARTEQDLIDKYGAAVGNAYTMSSGEVLVVEATISLSNTFIEVPAGASIVGIDLNCSKITSTNATTTVRLTGGAITLSLLSNLSIDNTGGGNSVETSDATSLLALDVFKVIFFQRFYVVEFGRLRFTNTAFFDSSIQFDLTQANGIADFVFCGFVQTGAVANLSSVFVPILTTDIGSMSFQNCDFQIDSATGIGIELESVSTQVSFGVINGGAFTGTGTFTSNFDESSNTWKFDEVMVGSSSVSSATHGIATVNNNTGATVTISAVDTWTDIDDAGVGLTWVQDADAEKISLDSANSGKQTYNGVRDKFLKFSGSVTVEGTSGTDVVEIGISINGAAPTNETITAGVVTNTQRTSITMPTAPLKLNSGQNYKLQIRNVTDADNVVIYQAKSICSF